MFKIALVLHAVIATTLMGIGVIVVLSVQMHAGWQPIAIAAAIGFVLSFPVSWLIARKIVALTGGESANKS
ncbi:MAG: hypothetical protein KDE15_13600 [Erythrobacter sp.]|nr:hypothetical protein [Erythrobacter sp.]